MSNQFRMVIFLQINGDFLHHIESLPYFLKSKDNADESKAKNQHRNLWNYLQKEEIDCQRKALMQ